MLETKALEVNMPKGIKDEARWSKAKKAVAQARRKDEDRFSDRDWGLVQHIYQQIRKASTYDSALQFGTGSVPAVGQSKRSLSRKRFVVYTVNPLDNIFTIVQYYDDEKDAKENVEKLKKLYGKYIQVGIAPNDGSLRLHMAMDNAKETLEELKE